MLKSTFTLIRGINADKEKQLWHQGITTWEELEAYRRRQQSLPFVEETIDDESIFLDLSRNALKQKDTRFFAGALERKEHYRIALEFPQDTLFLDIETTGLSRYYDSITLVGWCFRNEYRVLIAGDDNTRLREALRAAKVLVTYNGTIFDVPFLQKHLTNLELPGVHVDLRFLARRVGFRGGQKAIEEQIGLERPARLQEVQGKTAPLLWHRYRRGDLDALRLLIEYNHADLEGMKAILDRTVERLLHVAGVPSGVRKSVPRFEMPTSITWANAHRRQGIELHPYQGDNRPQTTYHRLCPRTKGKKPKIVGIDLTGSEKRHSGWCLLDGQRATTRLLGTDAEIVAATIKAKPELVSIDSPLSLPKGRISVDDSDPGRAEHGIMRFCERLLKQRGVNVYPALIPSMQRLTARGILLAQRLRALGIPVIESYPGAAQDILNIPRKRASLDLLREGLAEFGILGPFRKEPVTHDELDAITSALVGVFFWAGKFEGLGESEEEALIIPDLHVDATNWQRRIIVGISGPVAVGKTTAAMYLAEHGFHYERYSAVLENLLAKSDVARKTLQDFGRVVNETKGQRWLGRELLKRLPKEGNIVIDGLRFPDDHAFLIETFGPGFVHIHLTSSPATRQKRFKRREGSKLSFVRAENAPVEQRVPALRMLAQHVIDAEVQYRIMFRRISKALPITKRSE